jgi:hypothetical protein
MHLGKFGRPRKNPQLWLAPIWTGCAECLLIGRVGLAVMMLRWRFITPLTEVHIYGSIYAFPSFGRFR